MLTAGQKKIKNVKFHGDFPLLQRIWSGDMNVAKEEPFSPVVPMTVKEQP